MQDIDSMSEHELILEIEKLEVLLSLLENSEMLVAAMMDSTMALPVYISNPIAGEDAKWRCVYLTDDGYRTTH